MANLTTVGLTSGVPSSGTGSVSTLDNVIGTAGTPSAQVQTVQGVTSMTPLKVDGSGVTQPVSLSTVAVTQGTAANLNATVTGTVAATQSGTWNVTNVSGTVSLPTGASTSANQTNGTQQSKITDGTNVAAVKAASTTPIATDPALVVSISPNSVNANGQATMANSAPVVIASNQATFPVTATAVDQYGKYNTVAASQTTQALTGGGGGASGDYLAYFTVFPATAACGVVTLIDNATTLGTFAGGGTTALPSLVPFTVQIGAFSSSGAWKITTGANVSVIAVGKFT